MGNEWHEWPLMFFTVTGQCVIAGYLAMAALLLGYLLLRAAGIPEPPCATCSR